jgi:hypothetical protein
MGVVGIGMVGVPKITKSAGASPIHPAYIACTGEHKGKVIKWRRYSKLQSSPKPLIEGEIPYNPYKN